MSHEKIISIGTSLLKEGIPCDGFLLKEMLGGDAFELGDAWRTHLYQVIETSARNERVKHEKSDYTNARAPEEMTRQCAAIVQKMAESIYGENWGYYSFALRSEVLCVFEHAISELASNREKVDYVEIGSNQGLSMGLIGSVLKKMGKLGSLVSIDPYFAEGYIESASVKPINKQTREKALALYDKLQLEVRQIEKISSDGLKDLYAENKKADLIYIDGSHEQLNPPIDFGLSLQILNTGGVFLVDDHTWSDVTELKRICNKHCIKVAECWKVTAFKLK